MSWITSSLQLSDQDLLIMPMRGQEFDTKAKEACTKQNLAFRHRTRNPSVPGNFIGNRSSSGCNHIKQSKYPLWQDITAKLETELPPPFPPLEIRS